MAKKRAKKADSKADSEVESIDDLKGKLAMYEEVFGEIEGFTTLVTNYDSEIAEAKGKCAEAKDAYEAEKTNLNELEGLREGTKHMLYRYLAPGVEQILPLFDTMEKADDSKHGLGSAQWRKEPLSALRTSPAAIRRLNDADIILIGQLQDRVQEKPNDWFKAIEGMSAPMAASIVDRLNDFLFEKGAE